MLHLCVCYDLLFFVSFLTIYAVERNVVVHCHVYIYSKGAKSKIVPIRNKV